MDNQLADFDNLTPDLVIEAVEAVLDVELTNYTQPMPSYINRVYELKDIDDKYYIVKFYRPGRWSHNALLEEHAFMLDCAHADIPLAVPLPLSGLIDGSPEMDAPTLGSIDGFPFAVFERKGGRLWEAEDFESWFRIGSLLGRMHNAGALRSADNRPLLSARHSFNADLEELKASSWIHPDAKDEVVTVLEKLRVPVDAMFDEYSPSEESFIRVHGDFHSGNILDRPGEGLMLMDFDDMAMSLPVQDLWLLLPDHAPECGAELAAIIDGYREFRAFETETLMLIEPLRAIRMVYFLCWCGRQKNDFRFQHSFPDWGSKAFWQKEAQDLEAQYDQIKRAMEEQKIIY
ncbi:MAG: serine/threonine protein kinase [Spirochaetales bacterium]|uniref:Serine/threonine protein kinase n=1 Tax=Candidatus Thalassospirochaeta sargassi TaxID=3119039 RepID=A0AAJ1MJ41_9SPIO|nr:serine/threonine protein kinase [Spirochaetales bacterium]